MAKHRQIEIHYSGNIADFKNSFQIHCLSDHTYHIEAKEQSLISPNF